MIKEINERITDLKDTIDKQRELIIGINSAIENDGFIPSTSQQITINYICEKGKLALEEVEKLKEFKKKFK